VYEEIVIDLFISLVSHDILKLPKHPMYIA